MLTDTERLNYAEKRHYFWFGEVGMAAMLAGVFAFPLGIFLAGRAGAGAGGGNYCGGRGIRF